MKLFNFPSLYLNERVHAKPKKEDMTDKKTTDELVISGLIKFAESLGVKDPESTVRNSLASLDAICKKKADAEEAAKAPVTVVGGKTYEELLNWVKEESEMLSGDLFVDEGPEKGETTFFPFDNGAPFPRGWDRPRDFASIFEAHPSNFERVTEQEEEEDYTFDLSFDHGVIMARNYAEELLEAAEQADKELDRHDIAELIDELAEELFAAHPMSYYWGHVVMDFLQNLNISLSARVAFGERDSVSFPTFYREVKRVSAQVAPQSDLKSAIANWLEIHG